jgi:hypothetical protein
MIAELHGIDVKIVALARKLHRGVIDPVTSETEIVKGLWRRRDALVVPLVETDVSAPGSEWLVLRFANKTAPLMRHDRGLKPLTLDRAAGRALREATFRGGRTTSRPVGKTDASLLNGALERASATLGLAVPMSARFHAPGKNKKLGDISIHGVRLIPSPNLPRG